VQIEAVPSWNEPERLFQILTQFVRRPRLARITTSHGEASAEGISAILKTPDVITLPAVEGDRNLGKEF
jgi:hypothetical protein